MSGAWDIETDLLVIGAGACGLAAALAGAKAGLSVIIVEKRDRVGGNAARGNGALPAAGTRHQRALDVSDDPALFAADLAARAGAHDMTAVAERLAAVSADLVAWLQEVGGVPLDLVRETAPGHSRARLHAPPSRRGGDLTDGLVDALDHRSVPVRLREAAVGIIGDEDGITGAVVEVAREAVARIRAKKLMLASGGFAGAPELVGRFCPDAANLTYAGAPGSTGEALLWGAGLGADTAHLGAWEADAERRLLRTHGGLRIDADARVLRRDGKPIPNLFAGGGAAAGISGRAGSAGALEGNALLAALGLGWLAGRAAAAEITAAR